MRISFRWTHLVGAAVAALLVSGCSDKKTEAAPATQPTVTAPAAAAAPAPTAAPAPAAAPAADAKAVAAVISPEAAKEAEDIFSTRCSVCHGPNGDGNGPSAAALNPHPRNFHDATWQASVNDAHIEKIIQEGGPSVGKSPLMPPNPDLVGKQAVVQALRAKVRSFNGK